MDDILRARQPTTDILDSTFNIKGTTFQFLDLGGQRNERRKWINCFENMTSMLYITSLNDYDLHMSPDELKAINQDPSGKINRMKESLDLFHTILTWKKIEPQDESKNTANESLLFGDVAIIMFLNKTDLFEEKFHSSSLKNLFPDYENSSLEDAKRFIAHKFFDTKRNENNYYHFTNALDTKNVEVVIDNVKDTILQTLTKSIGLF